MKSKAPLMLMEQMIMLLVFALAAALCLQAFVKSEQLSSRSENRDRAVTIAQTAAETIRHCGGDMGNALEEAAEILGGTSEQGVLVLDYDMDWNPSQGAMPGYRLMANGVPTDVPGLWKALVQVVYYPDNTNPDTLFEIEVSWQEVESNG